MHITEISAQALSGGQSSKVTLSAVSAQSAIFTAPSAWPGGTPYPVMVTCDVPAFVRAGANPTAVADSDQYLAANLPYRLLINSGERLALIAGGAGNAYITPGV